MAKSTKAELLTLMSSWEDYQGLTPFGGASSGHAVDRCNEYLGNAGCILSMLASAARDAQTLVGKGLNSEFDNRTGNVMAGALEGVGNLIDLAAFMLEGG